MTPITSFDRRDVPDGFNLLIRRCTYAGIPSLIDQHALQPLTRSENANDDVNKGVKAAATYHLAPGTDLRILDAGHLQIAGVTLRADLYCLPSHAWSALVQQSPQFRTAPRLDDLLALARTPGVDVGQVHSALKWVAGRDLQPTQTAPLVTPDLPLNAEWLPASTLIHCTPGGDFFLTLTFRTSCPRPQKGSGRRRTTLDLGLDPITTLLTEGGDVQQFRPTPLTLPERSSLTPGAQAVYDQVVYGSGRLDAERVITYLLENASEVVAERLRLTDMRRAFVLRARDNALLDHHHAALPQALNAARIPLHRLPSGYTSTECPKRHCRHVSPDNRQGNRFECRRCGYTADAHVVACKNLLRRHDRKKVKAKRDGVRNFSRAFTG